MRETTQHFQFPVYFLVCCLTFTSVVLSLVRPSVWWKFKICSSFAHTFHSIYSAALASTSHMHTFDDSVYCCQLNCHRYNVLHRVLVLVHLLMPRYRFRAHRYGAGLPSSHLFTVFCHSTQWSVSKLNMTTDLHSSFVIINNVIITRSLRIFMSDFHIVILLLSWRYTRKDQRQLPPKRTSSSSTVSVSVQFLNQFDLACVTSYASNGLGLTKSEIFHEIWRFIIIRECEREDPPASAKLNNNSPLRLYYVRHLDLFHVSMASAAVDPCTNTKCLYILYGCDTSALWADFQSIAYLSHLVLVGWRFEAHRVHLWFTINDSLIHACVRTRSVITCGWEEN